MFKWTLHPKGAPLDYLQVGSPFIVSNLWVIRDIDINRFCKTMLTAWIRTRSTTSADRVLYTENSEKLETLYTVGDKRKRKKKALKENYVEECKARTHGCNHRPRIWLSMILA